MNSAYAGSNPAAPARLLSFSGFLSSRQETETSGKPKRFRGGSDKPAYPTGTEFRGNNRRGIAVLVGKRRQATFRDSVMSLFRLTKKHSRIVQQVERMTVNHEVAGSSPAAGAKRLEMFLNAFFEGRPSCAGLTGAYISLLSRFAATRLRERIRHMAQKENKAALERLVKEREDSLAEAKAQLAQFEAEEDRRQNIEEVKANYRPNEAPDRIEYDWEAIGKVLFAVVDEKGRISSAEAETIKKKFSLNLGPDPAKVYNCPECGASDSLNIWDFGSFDNHQYAVHCGHCDYFGPRTFDYGEAWTAFESWLRRHGYLKD